MGETVDARERSIRYGLRRFGLVVAMFGCTGVGFVLWSRNIHGETFIFPFGRLDPASASVVLLLVAAATLLYVAATCYVRFVRRPVVVLRDGEVSLPQGEFGLTTIVLRQGDVLDVLTDGPRRGGWRTGHVRHRGGVLAVRSSQLPDDEAFFAVCDALAALGGVRSREEGGPVVER